MLMTVSKSNQSIKYNKRLSRYRMHWNAQISWFIPHNFAGVFSWTPLYGGGTSPSLNLTPPSSALRASFRDLRSVWVFLINFLWSDHCSYYSIIHSPSVSRRLVRHDFFCHMLVLREVFMIGNFLELTRATGTNFYIISLYFDFKVLQVGKKLFPCSLLVSART